MFGSSTRTTIQNKHQNKHKNGSLSTKWIFYHGCPCPLTWTLQKMSEVNWREEVPTWSCESEGSGEILYEENSLWSLIRCSPNSSGIIGENSELLHWEKDVGQHELDKAFISQWDFLPLSMFTSMIGWNLWIFFEWKIKRINNADLFSQPPLLIFTNGANISGGHCIHMYNIKYCTNFFIGIYFPITYLSRYNLLLSVSLSLIHIHSRVSFCLPEMDLHSVVLPSINIQKGVRTEWLSF